MTRNRDIAQFLGKTESTNTDNTSLSTGSGVTVYDSAGLLPTIGLDSGDLAYVGSTKRMYSWTGLEWYEVERLNNTDPTITVGGPYTFDSSNAPDITVDTQMTDPQLLDMFLDTVTTIPANAVDSAVSITQDSDAGTATFSLQSGGTLRSFRAVFTAFEKGGQRNIDDSAEFTIDRVGIISLSKSVTSVDEGESFTITATTRGISDSGNLNYSISGITDSDLTSGSISGIIVIGNDSGSVSFTTATDTLTDSENATFTVTSDENDSAQIVMPINNVAGDVNMEALVVGGGGGGGSFGAGGGGGAGEVVDLQAAAQFGLASGTYTITIGSGGQGGDGLTSAYQRMVGQQGLVDAGDNGQNSALMSIQALGGGGGGGYDGQLQNATSGGSGGGAVSTGTVGQAQQGTGGYDSYRFGNAGGLGSQGQNANYVGGGGGGAGAAGSAGAGTMAMTQRGPGGAGGAGRQVAITGTQVWYGGGGGGGGYCGSVGGVNNQGAGAGGQGGGGAGAGSDANTSQNGQANTGGGGGGGDSSCGSDSEYGGRNGGSGIVVVAIQQQNGTLTSIQAQLQYTSSTSQRSGYTVYTFTGGSGSVTVTPA